MINPYISAIEDFSAERKGDRLHITFTVITQFGNLEVEDYV